MKEKLNISECLTDTIKNGQKQIKELNEVIATTITSLNIIHDLPFLIGLIRGGAFTLGTPRKGVDDQILRMVQGAERLSNKVKKESDAGYPFIYKQAVINLYSYLEATLKHLVVSYFKNVDISPIKEVQSIKVSLAEYIALSEEDKYDYLFENYEKTRTSGSQYSVSRFERLLDPLGLSGEVDVNIGKSIFELSQIRNNLLHRAGKVDRYLKSTLTYWNVEIGSPLNIDDSMYEEYEEAVQSYLTLLISRIEVKFANRQSKL